MRIRNWKVVKLITSFFMYLINTSKTKLNLNDNSPPQQSSSSSISAELAQSIIYHLSPPSSLSNSSSEALETGQKLADDHDRGLIPDSRIMRLEYLLIVCGVCYAAGSATLQAVQGTGPLSTTSRIVYAFLLISFLVFVLSVYIRTKITRDSAVAVHIACLFGVTAFLVALISPLTRRH